MVRKKRKYTGFIALAALVLFAPLVAMAYEPPSFEYDSSLQLSYAGRMAQDLEGNIYVADSRQGRVYVYDKYGRSVDTVNTIAQPAALAAGPAGYIYVASPHGVYLLGDNGQASSVIGQENFDSPVDMAIDAAGQIYLLDSGTRSIRVFTSTGVSLGEFAGGSGKYPVSLAVGVDTVSGEELVYVGYSVESLDAVNTEIVMVFDLNYNLVRSFGSAVKLAISDSGAPSGEVAKAAEIAIDDFGRVYLADTYGKRVDIYSERGDFLGEYSVRGDSSPVNLLFDLYGRLFVSLSSGRIDILSVDGMNVANVIPTAPSLLSPIGGMRIVSATPELVAGNSSDPNMDTLVYEFELASDPSMTSNVWSSGPVAEGGDGYTSSSVGVALEEDREYFWRVRSFDGTEYSRYSYVTRFFVNAINSAPSFDSYSPESDSVYGLSVGETVGFATTVSDSDRDKLAVAWFLNGVEISSGTSYSYLAVKGDVGENVVKVVLADGEFDVERQWNVTVMRPNTAPTSPALNSPVGSEDVLSVRPELSISNSFDAEGDALVYTFEVSRTDNFSDIVATINDAPSGEGFTIASVGADLVENSLYYWRARACETPSTGSFVAQYYCSNPSATGSFVVNTVNDPVGAPAVASPADAVHVNTLDGQLVLSVDNAIDPDLNDIVVYDFELALDAAFSAVISHNEGVVENETGSSSFAVTAEFEENRTYYWRARASDAQTVSAWVSTSFFVDNYNDAPTTPMVDSPVMGAESLSLNPVLSVINSGDLNGDTLSYIFEIDSAENFSGPARQRSGLITEADTITSWATVAPLLDNTRYYWRVKASDGVSESGWSVVNELFVNLSNDAPTAPVVKAPSGGVAVNSNTPELTVYAANDLDADLLGYRYQLSRTESFSSVDIESGLEGLAWNVDAQLEENATYYWRSRAIDEHGLSGAWSAKGQFMVNVVNEHPSAPVAGSYTYNSGDEVLLQIGSAVDPDGDTLSYFVELYSDRGMTAIAYSEEAVAGGAETISNAGVLNPGVYYWRVRAFDGEVFGSWSDTRIIRVNTPGLTGHDRADKAQGHKRF
ncbi:MAG: hypothetical protein RQ824_00580 [bacterium]|nr:hypothetical protein [bacterium]